MSAILNAIACWRAIGWPNASRSFAYRTHSSTQPWINPTASAEIAMRPSSRVLRNWRKPAPRSPRVLLDRHPHPVEGSSRVSDACHPTLR
jgi:hypothetical protein